MITAAVDAGIAPLRAALAAAVRRRVTGDDDGRLAALIGAPGPRWFPEGSAIREVHADAAMFVGGLRALLLQSLHPLVMAGVADHSDYRDDPWGRLQRTSQFLAATTYGNVQLAEQAIARVRTIHRRVTGTAADGRSYRATEPALLGWVHVTEVDSFLTAHQRFGVEALSPRRADEYVAEMATIARRLGVRRPPTTVAEVATTLRSYRAELASTPAAREAARFLLMTPPLPLVVRPAYGLIAASAVSMLPTSARLMLRLPPPMPVADAAVGRAAGEVVTRLFRWVMSTSSHPGAAPAPSRRPAG